MTAVYFSDYGADATESANTSYNSNAFATMLTEASLRRVPAIINGGNNTTYVIGDTRTITLHRDVEIQSDGAKLVFSGVTTLEAREQSGETITTTLSEDVAAFSNTIVVSNNTGATIGGVVLLYANTEVTPGPYSGYDKYEVAVITNISGNTITLDHSLYFFFTSAETVVTFRPKRSITTTNLDISISTNGLLKILGARLVTMSGSVITGLGTYTTENPSQGNPLQFKACSDITLSNTNISNSNIGVTITAGSANVLFSTVSGTGTLHPIDAQVWARNTIIRNGTFTNNGNAIVSHPSINTRFENCSSVETSGLYRNRSIGGGIFNSTLEKTDGIPYTTADGGGFTIVPLNADYLYLNAAGINEHTLEDFTSNTTVIQMAQGDVARMTRVTAPALVNNGNAYGAKTLYLTDCNFGSELISNTTVYRTP